MSLTDTITAISTATGTGAISIVRLSGPDALEIANKGASINLLDQTSHSIRYSKWLDPLTQEIIDEVMISVFRAPKTYTREDIVEINCHGGPVVTRQILQTLLVLGARLAQPGEFTQRAYLNGRIDLTQAEATMDLIDANSTLASKAAINAVSGSVSKMLNPLLDKMMEIITHIEVNIDYPEYDDVIEMTQEMLLPKAHEVKADLIKILEQAETGRQIKEGVKSVILGKPNVGKSSLLNALLEEDKAIVTDIAGTTRDLVEGWVRLQSITLHLIDTAGIRLTQDTIEQIGIDKSFQALDQAELVLVLLDGSNSLTEEDQLILKRTEGTNRIVVTNKEDILVHQHSEIVISAQEGRIQPLLDEINHRYEDSMKLIREPLLGNQRQVAHMQQSLLHLNHALEQVEMGIELDLVNEDLVRSYQQLHEILAPAGSVDLVSEIFSRFCLGK